MPSAVSDDPSAALEQLRSELVSYFHLPYYRAMIERSGFDPDAGATDEFIQLLSAVGRKPSNPSGATATAAPRRHALAESREPTSMRRSTR